MLDGYSISKIDPSETYDFILNMHYAKRIPSISFAYGLFINGMLSGILTIGKPASNPLCIGVMGDEYSHKVYELNRLCVVEGLPKNTLSYFVGYVLKDLRSSDLVIISYSDEGMTHKGFIYQATNWIYTGCTNERTDKYVKDGKHSRHYTEEFSFLRKCRTSKHRYVYFTDRKKIKYYLKLLKYPVIKEYPKGEEQRYVLGDHIKTKIINTNTGEVFYE